MIFKEATGNSCKGYCEGGVGIYLNKQKSFSRQDYNFHLVFLILSGLQNKNRFQNLFYVKNFDFKPPKLQDPAEDNRNPIF